MFVHSSYAGGSAPYRQFTDRLFFAIFPDAGTAGRIARLAWELRLRHGFRSRPLAPERFHVSLHHVGDYFALPQEAVAAACATASTVAAPRFKVAFNGAESFRGRPDSRPFVLRGDDGIVGLLMLQQALGAVMEEAGLGHHAGHYTPHLTLMYGDRLVADQPVDPVDWIVREFVLVHSLLGRSRYVRLASFPLGGQA